MAFPKYDYDGEEFYQQIYALAMNGATDAEIATQLDPPLDEPVFCKMKNGNYEGWDEEQNERRSAHISQVLTRARSKINLAVRAKWLSMALGKEKSKAVVERKLRDENGHETGVTVIQTTTTDIPANQTCLFNWLRHHDPEFRKMQAAIAMGDVGENDTEDITGLNINIAYNEASHLDLQGEKEEE